MNANNIFSLTHQTDIDGVGSAALIKMRYGIPNKNMFFTDYSLANMKRSKEEIIKAAKKGAVLIIADLGLNPVLEEQMSELIDAIKEKEGKVYWFDHHVWESTWIKNIASKCDAAIVNENKKFCATEIVRKELSLNSKFCKELADIVHVSDFHLETPDKKHAQLMLDYVYSITGYNQITDYKKRNDRLRYVAEVISNGAFLDSRIKKDATAFEKINTKRVKDMMKELIVLDKVAIGFQKGVKSTIACCAMLEENNVDLAIYVNLDNMQGHIRTENVDSTPLASYFGGGGHPHAAGFPINKKYDFSKKTDRKKFAELVNKKAKELCR